MSSADPMPGPVDDVIELTDEDLDGIALPIKRPGPGLGIFVAGVVGLVLGVLFGSCVVGCTPYSALRHSPFAEGGSAHDPDAKVNPYGAFGTDCGSYQCPEFYACGGEVSDGNPWGYGKLDTCWPVAGAEDAQAGRLVPFCGMLGCGVR